MIKLIAIDMDGTLLNQRKQLLEETKTIFYRFSQQRRGNFISSLHWTP